MGTKLPLVSICCITYNHEKYIRDAIEGFLMQKTTFPVEILIHDDASTDKTAQIVKEYAENHSDLIITIFQTENQYSQGIKPWPNFVFPRARGKYIALCEGDDYWTDPLKLQKQVDYLENNSDVIACFTNANFLNEITGNETLFVKNFEEGVIPPDNVILYGGGMYPTASLIFKREILNVNTIFNINELSGDDLLIIYLSTEGKIYFMNETTCVYRRWGGGVYSKISKQYDILVEQKKNTIIGLNKFQHSVNNKFKKSIKRRISREALFIVKNGKIMRNIMYFKFLVLSDVINYIKHLTVTCYSFFLKREN